MKKNSLAPLALACACCSAFRGPLSPLRAAARVVQLDHSVGGAPVPVDGADGVSALEAELQSALVAARNESASGARLFFFIVPQMSVGPTFSSESELRRQILWLGHRRSARTKRRVSPLAGRGSEVARRETPGGDEH